MVQNTLTEQQKAQRSLELQLRRDLKKRAREAGREEIRDIVDYYYALQKQRVALGNRRSQREKQGKTHHLMDWFFDQTYYLEKMIPPLMKAYAKEYAVGKWLLDIYGIGPVLAAGLMAHLDPRKVKSAGGFWRFAGLDPSVQWDGSKWVDVRTGQSLGRRRPFCARMKKLAFLIGESFVRLSGTKKCFYGQIYLARKQYEQAMNEAGRYKEYAEEMLSRYNWKDNTVAAKCYKEGKLPPKQIDMRARRYAVKLFLSHVFEAFWYDAYQAEPPKPEIFRIEPGKHVHYIAPPVDYHGYTGKRLFVEEEKEQPPDELEEDLVLDFDPNELVSEEEE